MARDNNFDTIATIYDRLARLVFGRSLEKAQGHFLNRIEEGAKVLILGGGSGRILEQLAGETADFSIDYVEASAKMIELARKRKTAGLKINFICGTQEDIAPGQYDCIITAFFLDVFGQENLDNVVVLLKGKLASKGIWLVTDFQPTGEWHHKMLLWLMHRFFRLTTRLQSQKLQPIQTVLKQQGLLLGGKKEYRNGLVFTALYRA